MNLPQEPLGIRRRGSSPLVRYSYLHSHSTTLHGRFHDRFSAEIDAPLPIPRPGPYRSPGTAEPYEECRSFGAVLEPRYIFGAESLDQ